MRLHHAARCRNPAAHHAPSAHSREEMHGFTLIELALASLVISIGVLVLYGLARSGIEYARMAEAETRATMFADNVFSGMGTTCQSLSRNGTSNEFERFWLAFDAGETNIAITAWPLWAKNGNDERLSVTGGSITNLVLFNSGVLNEIAGTNVPDHAIRYFVRVTLTNRTDCTPWPDSAMVQLDVSASRTGAAEWHTFITLFADNGGLP